MNGYAANNRRIKAADAVLSVDPPVYTEISGGHAYMVYPTTFSERQDGKPAVYRGTWTMTLRKTARGWVFTGSGATWGGTYSVNNAG